VLAKTYCGYIMSNVSKMLHVGLTNGLAKRVLSISKTYFGYAQKYNLFELVYVEAFGDIRDATWGEVKGCVRRK
jgi:predicted GIY-YIG superfamily endonuclease